MPYPLPLNEGKRLEALRRFRILDTEPEAAFDDFVSLASHICETPISLVSLVEDQRQWFKAKVGLNASGTPRDQSFCTYSVADHQMLVVEDATQDSRFADNPLVTGELGIRFYAGAPLITKDGQALGSLCVIDRKPRELSDQKRTALAALARRVMEAMEYRLASMDLATALEEVKVLSGLLPICGHCKNIRDNDGHWNRLEQYVQQQSEAQFSHGICPDCLHEHHPAVWQTLRAAGKV
jgi:GAF domain-containing protein